MSLEHCNEIEKIKNYDTLEIYLEHFFFFIFLNAKFYLRIFINLL